jgi:hypothetical protein
MNPPSCATAIGKDDTTPAEPPSWSPLPPERFLDSKPSKAIETGSTVTVSATYTGNARMYKREAYGKNFAILIIPLKYTNNRIVEKSSNLWAKVYKFMGQGLKVYGPRSESEHLLR